MVSWLVAAVALAQDCPKPGLQMIQEGTSALWDAYARVNVTAFDAASVVIRDGIKCVDAPLPVGSVAELHRTMAIIAFAAGQEGPCKKSWIAARTLDPTYVLPDDLYPKNHPVRVIFEEAVPQETPTQPLDDPSGVRWLVDGLPATNVPLDRAFVLQALDEQGAVIYSGYLWSIIDIPNLHVGPPEGLHTAIVRIGASALAGLLASGQQGDLSFPDERPASLQGAVEARVRLQPLRPIGADLVADGLGVLDLRAGPWLSPAIRAALTLGWDARTDDRRIRAGLRPGLGWQRIRTWSGTVDDPIPQNFTATTLSLGAGVEYATQHLAVDASVDPSFLLDGNPWQVATEGTVAWSLSDLVALEAGARIAAGIGGFELADAGTGAVVARRRDSLAVASFGIELYR